MLLLERGEVKFMGYLVVWVNVGRCGFIVKYEKRIYKNKGEIEGRCFFLLVLLKK